MGEETKELRRLVIKAYHVREVQWGSENEVTENGILTVDKESSGRYKRGKEEYISDISFRIICGRTGSVYEYDHGYYTDFSESAWGYW